MKRKLIRVALWIYLLTVVSLSSYLPAAAQQAEQVESVTITVSDIEKMISFYTGVLPFRESGRFTVDKKTAAALYGMGMESSTVTIAKLVLGEEEIYLQQFNNVEGRAIPANSNSNDLWFQHIAIVVSDMEQTYDELRSQRITHVSTFPQTLPETIPAAAGIKAFYFRDPDGHNLELIWFPEGKGDPRWQKETSELYLGIDHTAIAVSNSGKQKEFYEGILGLKEMGSSENFGTEQEHLNQIFGARLAITGLGAKNGIGVEFLEYITPPGGRHYPETSRPSDLWHWHSTIVVDDVEAAYQAAVGKYDIISTKIVNLESLPFTYRMGFLIRDVDGHAIFVVQH